MSRVFWDTMMFVYLLEGHQEFAPQVRKALERSYERGDVLVTSYLALGELMAGGAGDAENDVVVFRLGFHRGVSFSSFICTSA